MIRLTSVRGSAIIGSALNLAKNLAEPCTLKLPPSRAIEPALLARFRHQPTRAGLRREEPKDGD